MEACKKGMRPPAVADCATKSLEGEEKQFLLGSCTVLKEGNARSVAFLFFNTSNELLTPCLQAGVFHVVCFIGFSHDLEMQG
jgi:hypothetical protein